jgi:hypothetical protein
MLALKKKREAEAKAKAEADAAAVSEGVTGGAVQTPGSAPTTTTTSSSSSSSSHKVSLLGIGGKKTKADGSAMNGQKKRSPGEIRIQKGELIFACEKWTGLRCVG